MTLGIYIDSVLEVPGDESGIVLGAVGSVATFALRCSAGTRTAEAVTVYAPDDCEVSKDGTTYAASIVYAAGDIEDEDVTVYVKRTATTQPVGWYGGICSPRVADVTTEDIPEAPAAFTPTVSNVTDSGATVTFSTTDPDGDSLTYKVAVTESATPPADWGAYSDETSPYAASGLTDDTTYYAHVRAWDGTFATVGTSASFVTEAVDTTAPVLSGTLVVTDNGNGTVTLDWPDATDDVGVTGYDVEYGTTDGYGSSVSPDPIASTCQITGLALGTLHYFRVRAYDAAANASDWITATATPVFWSDDFGDASIDAARWRTDVAGGGTVVESGGALVINTMDSTTKQALVAAVNPVKTTANGTLTVVGLQGGETVAVSRALLVADNDWSIAEWPATTNGSLVFDCAISGPGYTVYPGQWLLRYRKPDGTTVYWDHAGDQWTTTLTFNSGTTWDNNDEFTWVVEIDATNSQARQLLYKGATLVTTTDYVAAADIRAWGDDIFLAMIDSSTSVVRDLTMTDVDYGATP